MAKCGRNYKNPHLSSYSVASLDLLPFTFFGFFQFHSSLGTPICDICHATAVGNTWPFYNPQNTEDVNLIIIIVKSKVAQWFWHNRGRKIYSLVWGAWTPARDILEIMVCLWNCLRCPRPARTSRPQASTVLIRANCCLSSAAPGAGVLFLSESHWNRNIE